MKKNLIVMLLLLAGAGSMKGQQEIPDGPRMVVTGNVVNTGIITAVIPIDVRTNGQIDNEEDGEIATPFLNVDAGTLVNNKGYICVSCEPDPCPDVEGYRTYLYPDGVGCWMIDNSKEGTYYAKSYGATNLPDGPGLYAPGERGYYYTYPVDDTVCPSGFRLPTVDDWNKLLSYVEGDASSDAEKLHWFGPAALAGSGDVFGAWHEWGTESGWFGVDNVIHNYDEHMNLYVPDPEILLSIDYTILTEFYAFPVRCLKR